ncbi:unnamed protein product, partial [Phaedon cochleariae]
MRMQLERSEVAFNMFTNGSSKRINLEARYNLTDEAIRNMSDWPPVVLQYETHKKLHLDKDTFQANLTKFRQTVNESTVMDVLGWYTSVNAALLDHLTNQIKENDNSGVWRYLLAFKNLLKSIESTGIASVYGVNYFGQGRLQLLSYISFVTHSALANDLLNTAFNYVPQMKKEYQDLAANMPNYGNIQLRNNIILQNVQRNASDLKAREYFDLMAIYTDELRKIQRSLRVIIQ